MCNLCNGTHVVLQELTYGVEYNTCPVCGPISEEQRQAERQKLLNRIKVAERIFGLEVM